MPSTHQLLALTLGTVVLGTALFGAESDAQQKLLQQARTAWEQGQREEALKLAGEAIAADEKSPVGYTLRGHMNEALGRHQAAVADYTSALERDPKEAELYQRRGAEHFKLGQIEKSIADFDRFIRLRPEAERSHWQRGIAYYYAGRFAEGAKQFAAYQTYDDNDVENAVWRYLCMARDVGVPQARAGLLRIKQDPRVPMMQVYALYKGELQPEEVLAAARAGAPSVKELNARLFYAHLYLGLYYEAAGDARQALEHIGKAADDHKIDHYMWDVARVHVERLRAKDVRR